MTSTVITSINSPSQHLKNANMSNGNSKIKNYKLSIHMWVDIFILTSHCGIKNYDTYFTDT